MKNRSILALLALTALCLVTSPLHAQAPSLINYQGRVTSGGVNFSGTGQFLFDLVDPTGTITYWSNDGTSTGGGPPTNTVSLTVTGGIYSVLLGDTSVANMTAIPNTVFSNADVRLRIWFNDGFNGYERLTPDQRLAPGGYLADGSVTSAKLTSNLSLGGTTFGTFAGDGSQLSGLSSGGGSSYNLNQVALLKWGLNTVDNSFAVGLNPSAICFDGLNIWVTNQASGTVTKLNASTGATLGTYSVGSQSQPSAICFDGAAVWVTSAANGNVTKLNATTGAAIGTYTLGSEPQGVCYDGAAIWVCNAGDNTVTKLNAATGAAIGTYGVGSFPLSLCFDGTNLWVANAGGSTVTELNVSTGAVIGTYGAGSGPCALCFDGANIWVANRISDTVTKFSAGTAANLGSYPVGVGPGSICFDGTNIWVSAEGSSGGLQEIIARTGVVLGPFAGAAKPGGLCFDGANIWGTNSGTNSVSKY